MKFYELVLSNKQQFEIDEEDFIKITNNLGSGNLIKVKQGIFNPSFIVAIIPIEKEGNKKIYGYIDEKTGVFIATIYKDIEPKIDDRFDDIKRLE